MEPEIPIPENGEQVPADDAGKDAEHVIPPLVADIFKNYFPKHFRLSEIFGGAEQSKYVTKSALPPLKKSFLVFIGFLKVLPLLCIAGFLTVFIHQYVGFLPEPFEVSWLPGDAPLDLAALLTAVSVGGLIGYGTNWLAIRMLFKPIEKRPIWGQGLIPSQRDRIISQLAKGIHENILSEDLIQKRIHESGILAKANTFLIEGTHNLLLDQKFKDEVKHYIRDSLSNYLNKDSVKEAIRGHIDEKLEENMKSGLKGFLFKTYKKLNSSDYDLVRNNLIENFPGTIIDGLEKLEEQSPQFTQYLRANQNKIEIAVSQMIVDMLDKIDIRELLIGQMEHFNERKLERMVWEATNEQLVYIQLLGTLLGILGGFLIWQTQLMLMIYGALFATLLGLDVLLFKLRRRKKTEPVETKY